MRRFKWYAIIAGAVLIFMGAREFLLSRKAKADPQALTCAALAKNGPGDNAHIVLSDFVFLRPGMVYETKKRSDKWTSIWVPALPLGGRWHERMKKYWALDDALRSVTTMPTPASFSVIVVSKDVPDERSLERLGDADTLQGLVINEIDSLSGDERKLLQEGHPGVDLDKCWIFEHKRTPKGMGTILGFLLAGLVLGALGVRAVLKGRG